MAYAVHTPTVLLPSVWPLPLSLATTRRISFDFSSSGYLDVSLPRVPRVRLCVQRTLRDSSSRVFPHSDISGSTLICSSPKLFAACHVLRRLLMPRHSPCALISLTCKWFSPFLVLFRIMQAQQIYTKLYLPFIKVSTMLYFLRDDFSPRPLLPCFSFSSVQFSRCKQGYEMYPQN